MLYFLIIVTECVVLLSFAVLQWILNNGGFKMWLDNASDIDILFYEPYAQIISDIAQDPAYKPLTIGVFGVWGAGKSTLLKLIKDKIPESGKGKSIKEIKKNICISINAWSFEGYEDAKVAVMESLLRELHEKAPKGLGEKITGLLKKLNIFKLSTKAVSVAAPIAASIAAGNPLPLVLGLSGSATDIGESIKNVSTAVQSLHDDYMKPETSSTEDSIVNNIRKFRSEFEQALVEADIDNVIVLIDDLDRCQPDRIIETLEAIKLFLSVKKTVFVIAVDDKVIQYAIKKKYPPLENMSVDLDKEYIEKIIQLPIYIPDLSNKDIENYLMLLVAQQYCSADDFAALIKKLRDEKVRISEAVIDTAKLTELTKDYNIASPEEYKMTAQIIDGIKEIISGNLKGNPRQAKRFLNTFITKRKLAFLYYKEDEINPKVLAKLLVLQKIDKNLFIELNEWNKHFTTINEEFKSMRESLSSDMSVGQDKYNAWHTSAIKKWAESEPVELEKIHLDRYFYLTRENLKKAEIDISTLSNDAKEMLAKIGNANDVTIEAITDEMVKLSVLDQNAIFEVIIPQIEQAKITLPIISVLFCKFDSHRNKIVDALKNYSAKIGMSGIPSMIRMRTIDQSMIDDLLAYWQSKGTITDALIRNVQNPQKKGKK